MEYQSILFEVAQGLARLTLNRPDKRNSFTGAMHDALREAPDIVQVDKGIRVRVITCAGRAFCAGQDLADTAFVYACYSYNRFTVASACTLDFLAPAFLGRSGGRSGRAFAELPHGCL